MKDFPKYALCFFVALFAAILIIAFTTSKDEKAEAIYVVDTTTIVETTTIQTEPPETEDELDELEYEEYDGAEHYRRAIYVTEYVIVIEFETEEPEELCLAAPEDEFQIFETYVYGGRRKPLPASERLQHIVHKYAEKYDLPYRTVLALLGVETTWNENPDHTEIHSGAKYIGIGCINEEYHAQNLANKGIDIYTLEGNVEGICWLLRAQYDRFGTIDLALMAYNGGGGYAQWAKERSITENGYSRSVRAYAESFK